MNGIGEETTMLRRPWGDTLSVGWIIALVVLILCVVALATGADVMRWGFWLIGLLALAVII